MPWVADSICPGEYCSFGRWVACSTITVHNAPDRAAPVIATLHQGDSVVVPTGKVVTLEPGRALILWPLRLSTGGDRDDAPAIQLQPGDTVYLLVYLGEDFWIWSANGEVGESQSFWHPDGERPAPARLLHGVMSEWWVSVTPPSGASLDAGWALAAWPRFVGFGGTMEGDPVCPK